ncbi:MAG: LCP family protein [Candidatus Saccharimonadales bacterium]
MDNFRKKTANNRSNKGGTVEGFVSGGRSVNNGLNVNPKGSDHHKTKEPIGRIGNFGTADGFKPNKKSLSNQGLGVAPRRRPTRQDDGPVDLKMHDIDEHSSKYRKHKKHVSRHKGSRFKKASVLFMLCIILFGGFTFGRVYLKAMQIFRGGGGAVALNENVDPALLNGEGDGRINILMLGKGGEGHTAPDLTDTILVASINPIQKEAAIVSVPRDLYVETEDSETSKINAVYANAKNYALSNTNENDPSRDEKAEKAGLEAIEKKVSQVLGIPIHYHSIVDFEGFKKAIDTVGGVSLNAPEEVYESMWLDGQNYTLNVQPGQQEFDGFRALAYSRSRHSSARGDFSRSERQRLILVALKDKVLSAGTLANPLKLNQLMSDFGDHIKINMTVDEMMRLYEIGKDIPSDKIQSIGLADPPNDYVHTSNIGGSSVVVPKEGIFEYSAIQSFIRSKLVDGYLANENAEILILNGTDTPGLAGKTVKELESYGYNLLPAGDAPTKGYTETVIVDLKNGENKYTKRYLEKRFGTTTVPNLPDSTIQSQTADFVIIIGQNEVSRLQN